MPLLATGIRTFCRAIPCIHRRFGRARTSLHTKMGSSGTRTVDTSKRLEALRLLMSQPEYDLEAVVIPSEDQRKRIFICKGEQLITLEWCTSLYRRLQ